MKKYLKETYFSKTTCRLLRNKLEEDLKKDQIIIEHFSKINFTNDNREIMYCLINNIKELPSCNNKECNNNVKFLSYSQGYREFCCIKCSKNKDRIKEINLFNGVHKIRKGTPTEKTIYFKEVRNITRYTYQQNKQIINPNNYKFGKAGVDGAYQLDHIVSVKYGFDNNIPAEIIGGLNNLRVIPWRVNSVKNKFLEDPDDFDKIVNSYIKIEYNFDLNIHEFIETYCLNKSKRVNTKINKEWFINRNIKNKYDEILKLTEYLDKDEKLPFRIFSIYFNLYKNKIIPTGNRAVFMRKVLSPDIDFVKLTGNDELDFKNNFMFYDKRLKRYRLKSNSYSWKETSNKKGILHLYYKYYKYYNSEKSLN